MASDWTDPFIDQRLLRWSEEQKVQLSAAFSSGSLVFVRTRSGATIRLDKWPQSLAWIDPDSIETLSCTPAMLAMTRSK